MTVPDQIEHASLTDVGVRRSLNEDNHAVLLASDLEKWQAQGHLFLVADGMGGHAVGELASELAAANIPHTYHKHADQGPAPALRRAFQEANATIFARGQQNPEFKEMGTTATALLLRPEGAWVGHVGDSRLYRIRDSKIEQLTFDHSHVWDIARRLRVNPEQIPGISSNLLMRSLGPQPVVQVDIEGPHPLCDHDIFVLCSDGLSGQVTEQELGNVVRLLPPTVACHFLVDLANLRGGPDNITVLIVRIGDLGIGPAPVTPAVRSARRTPWYDHVPWPLLLQVLGILLAIGAAGLTYFRMPGGVPAFLLAVVVIAAGLVALLIQHNRARQRPADEEDEGPPELHVYRQSPCRLELPLLNKLARAVHTLYDRAREKEWGPDWSVYERHHEKAQEYHREGKLDEAFAEYCRAFRVLTEAQARQRDDALLHVWDKEEENREQP